MHAQFIKQRFLLSVVLISIAVSFTPVYAEISNDVLLEKISSLGQSQEIILDQIRILREDMNKRFEQVDKRFEQVDRRFEQVDKRFEQVDKHFEQVDRRLEFLQNLLVALLVILLGTTIYSILGRHKERRADDTLKIHEVIEREERLEKIVREMANKDDDLKKRLRTAGLL